MSSEWAEQPAAPASHGAPGATLAAGREAMGWSVEQVADQLKLAVRQIVALEAGDYAALPGPAVVRGFVRAYAKILKLDAAPLVAMIALEAPAPNDATGTTVRRERPASFSEVRFPTHGKRARLPYGLIGAVVLVLGAGAAAWQFGLVPAGLLHGDSGASTGAGAASAVTMLPAPVVSGAPSEPGVKNEALQSPSVPLVSVPPPSAPGATVATGTPQANPVAGAAPAATPSGNTLVIKASADSWVEVRPLKKGAALVSHLARAGDTDTVEVTEPVILIVGKPDAVSATLRGAPVALPPSAGSTVSRVNIK